MNGVEEGLETAFGVIGGFIEGLAVGGWGFATVGFGTAFVTAGDGVTFFCVVVAFGVVWVCLGTTLWVILLIKDCFLGAGAGEDAGEDAAGFATGFEDGIETGFFGSFIPPVLEFLSALYFVFLFFGVCSLSTSTNSISLTFGFSFGINVRWMPKIARIVKIIHNVNKVAGWMIAERVIPFLREIDSVSSLVTAGMT